MKTRQKDGKNDKKEDRKEKLGKKVRKRTTEETYKKEKGSKRVHEVTWKVSVVKKEEGREDEVGVRTLQDGESEIHDIVN